MAVAVSVREGVERGTEGIVLAVIEVKGVAMEEVLIETAYG